VKDQDVPRRPAFDQKAEMKKQVEAMERERKQRLQNDEMWAAAREEESACTTLDLPTKGGR